MYGCESLDHKEGWVLKNWCFWTVVLEKTFESPLDGKEIQPVHPKGNQFRMFIGRTDAEAEATWCEKLTYWKRPCDAEKDWGQEEKWTTEDEVVGWHHWLNGLESERTPGDREVQGSWCAVVHRVAVGQDLVTEQQQHANIYQFKWFCYYN